MSSLVKQLPILFPCRSFLTSGKIVSGCYVHFMAAYVLKVERWLTYVTQSPLALVQNSLNFVFVTSLWWVTFGSQTMISMGSLGFRVL